MPGAGEERSDHAIRLSRRDRIAFIYRVTGAGSGFALMAWAFATSSWSSPWTLAPLALIVIGGGAWYHVLTSVVSCPTCTSRITNFRISEPEGKRKLFLCRHCGAVAYLTEGFYWQEDFAG